MRVPAKLKKQLGKNYIITKGTNGSLFLFTKEGMEKHLLSKFEGVSLFDLEKQKAIRAILSSSFEVEEDKQGRFLLPKALRVFANIKKNVYFIGVGSHMEIWNASSWEKYLTEEVEDFDKLLGGLKNGV